MKNVVKVSVIISVLFMYGMQIDYAQVPITISWNSECPHTCTTQEECNRVFVYKIYEVCGESQDLVCSDTSIYNYETSSPVNVECDYDCSSSHEELCFLIWVDAYKVCVGPGGSNIICHGDGSDDAESCEDLMDGNQVTIVW